MKMMNRDIEGESIEKINVIKTLVNKRKTKSREHHFHFESFFDSYETAVNFFGLDYVFPHASDKELMM